MGEADEARLAREGDWLLLEVVDASLAALFKHSMSREGLDSESSSESE